MRHHLYFVHDSKDVIRLLNTADCNSPNKDDWPHDIDRSLSCGMYTASSSDDLDELVLSDDISDVAILLSLVWLSGLPAGEVSESRESEVG